MLNINPEILKPVVNFLTKEIKLELIEQDHYASGALDKSIESVVEKGLQDIQIVGYSSEKYSRYVNDGRLPGNFVPIDALIEWITNKRLDLNGKSEEQVAHAISVSIERKGIPHDGDNRKKFFVSKAIENSSSKVNAMIQSVFDDKISLIFDDILLDILQ